jgi:hypothetical protein
VDVTLHRFAWGPWGTFGVLKVGNLGAWYTVELPWRDNEIGVSCIPTGEYPMSRHDWFTKPEAQWRVDGVEPRSDILFHVGNTVDDLRGCIAPGQDLGWVHGRWAVTNSRVATRAFNGALVPRQAATLGIYDDPEAWKRI